MVKLPPEWGTEPVPAEKRSLGIFDYFVLWSSLAVGLLVLQAGGLLIPGLSTVGAIIVAVLGSIVGSLMLGLAGGLGSKYGIPTMVSLRAVLGLKGSYIPTIVNVLQLIGWASFEILIMANSASLITGPFLGSYTTWNHNLHHLHGSLKFSTAYNISGRWIPTYNVSFRPCHSHANIMVAINIRLQ